VGHMTLSRFKAIILFSVSVMSSTTLYAQTDPVNRVIEKLQLGLPAIGTFTRAPSSDLDFAVIDEQYGEFDIEGVNAAVQGMKVDNGTPMVAPIVRIPLAARDAPQAVVEQLLAAGVYGLMFPDVETKSQAEAAVGAMASAQDDLWPLAPGGKLIAMIQIESPLGIENLDAILEVAGIGVLFLGPTDMATAIGAEGPDAPQVEVLVQQVLEVCLAQDIACGYPIVAASPEDAKRQTAERLEQGFKVLAVMTRAQ